MLMKSTADSDFSPCDLFGQCGLLPGSKLIKILSLMCLSCLRLAMLVYKFLRVCRLHLATSIANDCELASDVDTLSVRLLSLRIPEYTRKSLLSVLFIFSASGN